MNEYALVQGHFAVGEKVAEGAGRAGAKFAPGVNNSPPHAKLSGVARLLVAALQANDMTPFGTR